MTMNSVSLLRPRIRQAVALAATTGLLTALSVQAQMLQQPPQMGEPIPPNMVFTLDDSGSMWWECVPDDLCVRPGSSRGIAGIPGMERVSEASGNFAGIVVYDDGADGPVYINDGTIVYDPRDGEVSPYPIDPLLPKQLRSSAINPTYYDPQVHYLPWLKADGSRYPDSPPNAAPILPGDTEVQNLEGEQTVTATWYRTNSNRTDNAKQTAHIARYYTLKSGESGDEGDDFDLMKIESGSTYPKGSDRVDCAGTSCTYEEEIQNFANWYTYYRNRALTAIAGGLEAFAGVPSNFRVGYGRINQTNNVAIDGVNSRALIRGVRPFVDDETNNYKTEFYDWLAGSTKPSGSTPLRRAMDDIGKYFQRKDNKGPWGNKPGFDDGANESEHVACRRSIHVLMTDGFWNSSEAGTAAARANVDNTAGPTIYGPGGQSYTYSPARPYKDDHENTLADVAMYYWNRDLRPDLPNKVSPITTGEFENPAFWQHMTNFTIAFGVDGTLDRPKENNPGDWPGLLNGPTEWPDPGSGNTTEAVDDLWHAALNSRGQMFSARNASEFKQALDKVIGGIKSMEGSEAGVAVSTVTLPPTGSDTKLYEPQYSPPDVTEMSDWIGDVVAKKIDPSGKETGEIAWQASNHVPAHGARSIFTYDLTNAEAKEFLWGELTEAMQDVLLGADHAGDTSYGEQLVDYLRGNADGEDGIVFRKRTRVGGAASPLGDIVNSTPLLVHDQVNALYQFLPPTIGGVSSGRNDYAKFFAAKKLRQPQLLVGANDGMLHGFSDEDGSETFAFTPGTILASLPTLADPDYTHRYFVDGPLYEADVYDIGSGEWRNLVQAAGGAGGKYLYAINMPVDIDATSPISTAESTPGLNDILWELNNHSAGFEELGHVLTKPETGVTMDGRWVTIFGNGYYSSSGKAILYIVDAVSGELIKTIEADTGSGNGLGGVGVVRDGQLRIVAAYAGDLKGNLWKFDLSSADSGDWAVAFDGDALFIAKNDAGQLEPITAKPAFRAFPTGGVMVLFGTGQLFEEGDITDTSARTLYGVWDNIAIGGGAGSSANTVAASDLVTQVITSEPVEGSEDEYVYRKLAITPVDFATKRGWRLPLTLDGGERMINQPQIRFDRVFMQTVVSNTSEDVCENTGLSRRAYILDPFMSGRQTPPFDADGDGTYESSIVDLKSTGENILVVKSGIPRQGAIKGAKDPGGPIVNFGDETIRRTWREIIMHP